MELQIDVLSTLAEFTSLTSFGHQYNVISVTLAYLGRHWYRSLADSVCHIPPFFSIKLQTKILTTETSAFLKQIVFSSLLILCCLCNGKQ